MLLYPVGPAVTFLPLTLTIAMGPITLGISFMGQFRLTRLAEKSVSQKKRKSKVVEDLGEKVIFVPSFYDYFALRSKSSSIETFSSSKRNNHKGESKCELSLSHSLTDSEVVRCNNRIVKNSKSEVGKKVWDVITLLGVVSNEHRDANINFFENMEERD